MTAAKPKPPKGYFARAYNGEVPLRALYWVNGFWTSFAASFFLNLGVSVPALGGESHFTDFLLVRPLFLLPTVIAWLVAHVWFFRAVWRCAPNSSDAKWTRAARWSLFVAGPAWLPFILAQLLWQAMFLYL